MGTLNVANLNHTGDTFTTNANLNFGGSWTDAPPGTIIKVSYGEGTTEMSTTAAQAYYTIHSVNHTALATNSKYFLTAYCHAYDVNPGTRANLGFSVTIGGVTTRIQGVDGSYGDAWGTAAYPGANLNRSTVYTSTAAAGTVLTFNLMGASWDTNDTRFNYTGYGHISTLTIMEIAT